MSLDVPGWLLVIALATAPQTAAESCAPASLAALAAAAAEVVDGLTQHGGRGVRPRPQAVGGKCVEYVGTINRHHGTHSRV